MAKLTIHSRPQGGPCPPVEDIGGQIKIDETWGYLDLNPDRTPIIKEVEPGTHTIFTRAPAKDGKCNWQPAREPVVVDVGPNGATVCTEWKCLEASAVAGPLSGVYGAKRVDQTASFDVQLNFQVNSQYCLHVGIHAPGNLDHGEGHLHMCTEPGNHGRPHRGDFMQANAPLTECFLQGTFSGPRGEQGSFRMLLTLAPAQQGLFTPVFGGFIAFVNNPAQTIQIVFTRTQPVAWPGTQPMTHA